MLQQCYRVWCSQVCGELKVKLHPLMEVMFSFHSSQTKSVIKKHHVLAEELKEGANFAFKVCWSPVEHAGHCY